MLARPDEPKRKKAAKRPPLSKLETGNSKLPTSSPSTSPRPSHNHRHSNTQSQSCPCPSGRECAPAHPAFSPDPSAPLAHSDPPTAPRLRFSLPPAPASPETDRAVRSSTTPA